MIPENCWEWDGYLGECIKYHPAHWWQYANVFSISATFVAFVAAVVIAVLLLKLAR